MSEAALPGSIESAVHKEPDLTGAFYPIAVIVVAGAIACVPLSVAYSTYFDIDETGEKVKSCSPFPLLLVALLIALSFEFVSGFHGITNAVATLACTCSLPAGLAVVWSGPFDLAGALVSSGAAAFGLLSLLPVEPGLQRGTQAFGLPASSSNSREERPTLWRPALRPRRGRTVKWPAGLER